MNELLGVESGMFETGHFGLCLATLHKSPQGTQEHNSSAGRSGKENAAETSALRSHQSPDRISKDVLGDGTPTVNPFSAENTATAGSGTPLEEWDRVSQPSRANMIRETREWYVDYEAAIGL